MYVKREKWLNAELAPARIAADVTAGLFFLAQSEGVAAGVVKFQLKDSLFWPDVPRGQSAFDKKRLRLRLRVRGKKHSMPPVGHGAWEKFSAMATALSMALALLTVS
jgi:hypothetical protein